MRKTFIFLFAMMTSLSFLQAQNTFYGTIAYTYEMEGENAEMMKMMMPEKMVVVYGEEGVLTYMDGGMMGDMMGKVVVNTKTGESFIIKDAEKAVYVMKKEDLEGAEEEADVNVEEVEGESMEVLGYKCSKYQIETTQNGETVTQYIWATKKLKAPDLDMPNMPMNNGMGYTDKIDGFPLIIEVAIPNMNTSLIMKASELDKTKPDAKNFKRPEDYETKDFSEFMKF